MLGKDRVLAVIPARAGSKRLPNKNIRDFAGSPLICWSVQSTLKSTIVDHIVVSSDSDEILRVASRAESVEAGVQITFAKRPSELASDDSSSVDAALDVLKSFPEYEILIWLQPTSPLRSASLIDDALRFYQMRKADSVISVCPSDHPPSWINELDDQGLMSNFYAGLNKDQQSERHTKYFQLDGSIFIVKTDLLKETKSFLNISTHAFVVSPEESADIDTLIDFKYAEFLYSELLRNRLSTD